MKKMTILLALVTLGLAGCVRGYIKAEATEQEFYDDYRACGGVPKGWSERPQKSAPGRAQMATCMEQKGWQVGDYSSDAFVPRDEMLRKHADAAERREIHARYVEEIRRQDSEAEREAQAEENRQKEEARAASAARKKHRAALRSGARRPQSCSDIAFLRGLELDSLSNVGNAAVKPNGGWAKSSGTLDDMEEISQRRVLQLKQGVFFLGTTWVLAIVDGQTPWFQENEAAIGDRLLVFGKYRRNKRLPLVNGGAVTVPVIDAVCVEAR